MTSIKTLTARMEVNKGALEEDRECTRCKRMKPFIDFTTANGRIAKLCIGCRAMQAYNEREFYRKRRAARNLPYHPHPKFTDEIPGTQGQAEM